MSESHGGRSIIRFARHAAKARGHVRLEHDDDAGPGGPASLNGGGYPLTTPSGVSRRTGLTRDADAAMTVSMSL
jgi:hypothetical protein